MKPFRLSSYRLAILLAIIWLGTLLRVWQLGQIPPGLNFDEAEYGTDAISIVEGNGFPGFPANFGREPFFSYAVAGAFLMFGVSPWAVRIVSAAAGILTIPAIYILARRLFHDQSADRREVLALLAAVLLAVLPWHFSISRMAFRAILVPLFSTLACYGLWRGMQTQQQRWIIAAGVFVGAGLHTYQAARLLPFLVVVALILFALRHRQRFSWVVKETVLVGVVALIVFAPLGYYFLTHPGAFLERATQANVARDAASTEAKLGVLAQNAQQVLGMFAFAGDRDPRFNIPRKPLFDPFLALLFVGGLVISLRRIRRPEYGFILIWLMIMLLPSVLADFAPSYKRTVGAIPSVVLLLALGFYGAWQFIGWVAKRVRPPWRPVIQWSGWGVLLAASIVSTGVNLSDYFITWGQANYLYLAFDAGLITTGRFVQSLPPDERVYLSPVAADYPGFVVGSLGRRNVRSFDGRRCTVLPDKPAAHTTYVLLVEELARRDRRSEDVLAQVYPSITFAAQDQDPPYFKAAGVPAGSAPVLAAMQPLSATFGDTVELLGYDTGGPMWQAGQTARLTLFWRTRQALPYNYILFVHITPATTPGSPPLVQDDREPCDGSYPTTAWLTDEIVAEFRKLEIPADLPPGDYDISVGWYLLSDMSHLPITHGPAQIGENRLTVGRIRIEQP